MIATESPHHSTHTAATAKQPSCSHSAHRGLRSSRMAMSTSSGESHSRFRFHRVHQWSVPNHMKHRDSPANPATPKRILSVQRNTPFGIPNRPAPTVITATAVSSSAKAATGGKLLRRGSRWSSSSVRLSATKGAPPRVAVA